MADSIFWLFGMVPATVAASYYFVLTTLGRIERCSPLAPREGVAFLSRSERATLRLTALIPAHNEAAAVGRTIFSAQTAGCGRVLVVADNCTDATASVARAAGADVVVRTDPANRGKGYAVGFGLEHAGDADAVLILDADCELVPGSVAAYAAAFAAGAEAVQGGVIVRRGAGPAELVAAVGSVLDTNVAAGKSRLGLSVPLRGTGMAFRTALLKRVPWAATGLVEDAEYAAKLTASGVPVRFAFGAEVRTDAPPGADALYGQRRRWRAAFSLLRLVESKPLVLAHLLATLAAATALGVWAAWLLVVPTLAVYLPAVWRVGGTRHLMAAPVVVGRLALVTLGGAGRRGGEWHRTRRPTDPASSARTG